MSENQSNANMAQFFRRELTYIHKGGSIDDVFTRNQRRRLQKHGVLMTVREDGKKHSILTPFTREVLGFDWPRWMSELPPDFWSDKELNTWLNKVSVYGDLQPSQMHEVSVKVLPPELPLAGKE